MVCMTHVDGVHMASGVCMHMGIEGMCIGVDGVRVSIVRKEKVAITYFKPRCVDMSVDKGVDVSNEGVECECRRSRVGARRQ